MAAHWDGSAVIVNSTSQLQISKLKKPRDGCALIYIEIDYGYQGFAIVAYCAKKVVWQQWEFDIVKMQSYD